MLAASPSHVLQMLCSLSPILISDDHMQSRLLPSLLTTSMLPTRAHQPISLPFGKHFTSPVKPRNKKKTNTNVTIPNQVFKYKEALARLKALQQPTAPCTKAETPSCPDYDVEMIIDDGPVIPYDDAQDNLPPSQHRIHPDHSSRQSSFFTWTALLPTLLVPFLDYINRSNACILPPPTSLHSTCEGLSCKIKTLKITCLYYNCKSSRLQRSIAYPLCQILRP
jgi:hypothetical protein